MAKTNIAARVPWTKGEVRMLKAYSKSRTPVVEVAKAMNGLKPRSGRRQRRLASASVTGAESCPTLLWGDRTMHRGAKHNRE